MTTFCFCSFRENTTETVCFGSWILTIYWAHCPWQSLCQGNRPVPCWWSGAAASSPGALCCVQSLLRLTGGVHPWLGPRRQTGSETWSTRSMKNTQPTKRKIRPLVLQCKGCNYIIVIIIQPFPEIIHRFWSLKCQKLVRNAAHKSTEPNL